MLNEKLLKQIESDLVVERKNITTKQSESIDIDLSGDEVDEIQGKILANVQMQLSSRDKSKIKLIDTALEKISEGSYGFCEGCGEEISEKRLLINPIFATCISCAEQLEMEEKRKRF